MTHYFAHPISDFSTHFERRTVAELEARGFWLENPNQEVHQQGYRHFGMGYYTNEVLPRCDGCIFVAFPGGKIGSGVAIEVEWFLERGLPVLEYVPATGMLDPVRSIDFGRVLTREETRGASKVLSTLPNGGR